MSDQRYTVDSPWPVDELNERLDVAGKQREELEARRKAMELATYMGNGWKASVFYSPLLQSWSYSVKRRNIEVRTSPVRPNPSELEQISTPWGCLFHAWFSDPRCPGAGMIYSNQLGSSLISHWDPKEALRLGLESCREALRDRVEALDRAESYISEWSEEEQRSEGARPLTEAMIT